MQLLRNKNFLMAVILITAYLWEIRIEQRWAW